MANEGMERDVKGKGLEEGKGRERNKEEKKRTGGKEREEQK